MNSNLVEVSTSTVVKGNKIKKTYFLTYSNDRDRNVLISEDGMDWQVANARSIWEARSMVVSGALKYKKDKNKEEKAEAYY